MFQIYAHGEITEFTNAPIGPTYPTGYGNEVYYYGQDGLMRHSPARTKYSSPYNYDPIVLFDTGEDPTDSAYSDRMRGWAPEKFDKCLGMGEMRFSWGDRDAVNKMIRAYFDDPLREVIKVIEMCNVSSGYPVWLICWKTEKKEG